MQMTFRCILGRLSGLFVALLLLACEGESDPMRELALQKLQVGVATEAEVTNIMGKPVFRWENPDSTITLEYPMGPQGVRTWMASVSLNGVLVGLDQVLTDDNFKRIVPGMAQEDVRRMLGKPQSVVQFKRNNEEVWDWKYQHGHEARFFNVHFDMNTKVVQKTSFSEIFNR